MREQSTFRSNVKRERKEETSCKGCGARFPSTANGPVACTGCGIVLQKLSYAPFWESYIPLYGKNASARQRLGRRYKWLMVQWQHEERHVKRLMQQEARLIGQELIIGRGISGDFYWQKFWDKQKVDEDHPLMHLFYQELLHYQQQEKVLLFLQKKRQRAYVVLAVFSLFYFFLLIFY